MAEQTQAFLVSCILGVGLGLFYEIFRITRVAIQTPAVIVAIEDIIYFIICAFVSFQFIMNGKSAKLWIFLLIGELIGWIVYHFTLGYLIIKVSSGIIRVIKMLLHFLFYKILLPILKAVQKILRFIFSPVILFYFFMKKKFTNLIFALKHKVKVLYNNYKVHKNKKKKITKKKRTNKRKKNEAK